MKMLLGEVKQRLKIVGDSWLPMERRVFALMETVFVPVSFLTLVGLVVIAALWTCVVEMIPKFQPEIERLIRTEGMPFILEKLDIQGRIQSAVDKKAVAEFHGMINEVAARHLGAIQVLGYLLGAAAGALTFMM